MNVTRERLDMYNKQAEIAGNTKEEKAHFEMMLSENGLVDTFRYFTPEKK